jgi:hypothetical protein
MRPYLDKTLHKKGGEAAGGVAQGIGLEFKLQYHKKTQKNLRKIS